MNSKPRRTGKPNRSGQLPCEPGLPTVTTVFHADYPSCYTSRLAREKTGAIGIDILGKRLRCFRGDAVGVE